MTDLDTTIAELPALDLAVLDEVARFHTRRDRKYIVPESVAVEIVDALPNGTRALETDGDRWSLYQSTYYDTPSLDTYFLAARKRPHRFKVRTRCYVASGLTVVEVKSKDRSGRTIKERTPIDATNAPTSEVRGVARRHAAATNFADTLRPTLTNRYARATLVLEDGSARVTIDADFEAIARTGARTRLADRLIIETKTSGKPSIVDRLLWERGYRPIRFSKYTTALAATNPDLPANRWQRTVCRLRASHGGRPAPLATTSPAVRPGSRSTSSPSPTSQGVSR